MIGFWVYSTSQLIQALLNASRLICIKVSVLEGKRKMGLTLEYGQLLDGECGSDDMGALVAFKVLPQLPPGLKLHQAQWVSHHEKSGMSFILCF